MFGLFGEVAYDLYYVLLQIGTGNDYAITILLYN